ncbi:MAG: 5'-methylthioadenosine/adenosylhomocysteine nucleosidase [Bacteroides sp.]|nr:5'-methylthioadenosine/adenosylhomocysteine nucleosidase [Bacteroides sp.]MDE7441152.1 5'-methylthioadenosine/adenosylhomocysteine nucleosidase [Muribaculaceae bacterium]
MLVAILAAMDKELQLLLSLMPQHEKIEIDGVDYYRGQIGGKEVVAGKCGIGKVNAALNTYRLIETLHPDIVINSGVAGGASSKIGIGEVLIADRIAYHDVWCGPGTEIGAADGYPRFFLPAGQVIDKCRESGMDCVYGLICSGDRFIHTAEEVAEIRSNFPDVLAVDMESAAIAHTCSLCGVPVLIVRVMSDTPGEGDNISQYENFWTDAPKKTFACVEKIVEDIL